MLRFVNKINRKPKALKKNADKKYVRDNEIGKGTMAYNVGVQFYNELDANALKSITNDIFENATLQTKTSGVKIQTVTGIDLYNGKSDSETARQVAMSNAGLQVTLSNNLDAKLKFLNAKAATQTFTETKALIALSMDEINRHKQNYNPFGQAANKKPAYLFINAA